MFLRLLEINYFFLIILSSSFRFNMCLIYPVDDFAISTLLLNPFNEYFNFRYYYFVSKVSLTLFLSGFCYLLTTSTFHLRMFYLMGLVLNNYLRYILKVFVWWLEHLGHLRMSTSLIAFPWRNGVISRFFVCQVSLHCILYTLNVML